MVVRPSIDEEPTTRCPRLSGLLVPLVSTTEATVDKQVERLNLIHSAYCC